MTIVKASAIPPSALRSMAAALLVLWLLGLSGAGAQTVYVDVTNGFDANAGTSPATAVKTISTGISKAIALGLPYTNVHVAAGFYTPGSGLEAPGSTGGVTLVSAHLIKLRGGWTPGSFAAQGGLSDLCATGNITHVVRVVGCTNVLIEGFTIRGGWANGGGLNDRAGGLLVQDTYGSTFSNLILSNNTGLNGGGACFYNTGTNRFHLLVSSNRGSSGDGGININGATQNIYSGVISSNYGATGNGGAYMNSSISNQCGFDFIGNSTGGFAGGCSVYVGSFGNSFTGRFQGNSATTFGGALVIDGTCTSNFISGVFISNSAPGVGALLMEGGYGSTISGAFTNNTASAGSGGGVMISNSVAVAVTADFFRNTAVRGGGLYVHAGASNRIAGGFYQNAAAAAGGGLFVSNSLSNFIGGTFGSNAATNGGGLYLSAGYSNQVAALFASNWATTSGGGAYGVFAHSNYWSGAFTSNATAVYGGGLALWSSVGNLLDSPFTWNRGDTGGGLLIWSGGWNTNRGLLATNWATTSGGGAFIASATGNEMAGLVLSNGSSNGGGLSINNSPNTVVSGSVVSNAAGVNEGGGGIGVFSGVNALLTGDVLFNTSENKGGGIILWNVSGCRVTGRVAGNSARSNGGGINLHGANGCVVQGPVYSNTAALNGGGIYVYGGPGIGSNTLDGPVAWNVASNSGGGVYLHTGYSNRLTGPVASNHASIAGGGVYLYLSQSNLISSTLSSNAAATHGGGLVLYVSGQNQATGNIIGNAAGISGGGVVLANFASNNQVTGSLSSNRAQADGGGIWSDAWSVSNSIVSALIGNTAGGWGGGYFERPGLGNGLSSIISNNSSGAGGAVYLQDTTNFRLVNCMIAGNGGAGADSILILSNGGGMGGLFVSNTFFSGTNLGKARAIVETGLNTSGHFLSSNGFDVRSLGFLYQNGNGAFVSNFEFGALNTAGSPRHDAIIAAGNYPYPPVDTLYVDVTNGSDAWPGISSQYPARTLQRAEFQAPSWTGVHRVRVAAGIYGPGNGLSNVLQSGLYLTNHNMEWSGGWDSPGFSTQATRSELDGAGVLSHVLAISNGTNVRIDGFVLRGGAATNGGNDGHGGGVFLTGTTGCILTNLVVSNNLASNGGGMALLLGTQNLFSANIRGNQAIHHGGGIYQGGGFGNAIGGDVTGNIASNGGGLFANNSASNTWAGDFLGNRAQGNGGAVYLTGTSNAVTGKVATNSAGLWGGGLYLVNASRNLLAGDVVSNGAQEAGGILFHTAAHSNTVAGNLVSNFSASTGGGAEAVFGSWNQFLGLVFANEAAGAGGGLSFVSASNNTLSGALSSNRGSQGGGMSVQGGASNTVTGAMTGNSAVKDGGAYYEATGFGNRVSSIIALNGSLLGGAVSLFNTSNFTLGGSSLSNNATWSGRDSALLLSNTGTLAGLVVSNCLFAGTNNSIAFAILETGSNVAGHTVSSNVFIANSLAFLYGNTVGVPVTPVEIDVLNTPGSPRHDAGIATGNTVTTNTNPTAQTNYLPPLAVLLSPPVAGTNFPVYFSSASVAGTRPIASFLWTFGDGSGTNGADLTNVQHTYGAIVTNAVTLTVVDDLGVSSVATNGIMILGYYPVTGTVRGAVTNGVLLRLVSASTNQSALSGVGGPGFYQFWVSNDSYNVTPSRLGYRFSPTNIPVTVSGGAMPGMDFTGSEILPLLAFLQYTNLQQVVRGVQVQVTSDAPEMLSNGILYWVSNLPGVPAFATNWLSPWGISNGFDTSALPDGNYQVGARVVDQPFGRTNIATLTLTFYNQLSKMNGKDLAGKRAVAYNTVVNTDRGDLVELFFYLNAAQTVRISLYDKKGRLIRAFPERAYPAGPNRVTWDTVPRNLEAGVYFAQFDCPEFSKPVPVVLSPR